MIVNFKHKGLQKFHLTGSKVGIDPKTATRLEARLDILDEAETIEQLLVYRAHYLGGHLEGHIAINVTGNWRLVFRFEDQDIHDVDLVDYH